MAAATDARFCRRCGRQFPSVSAPPAPADDESVPRVASLEPSGASMPEPGTSDARKFEGHMRAAGLLLAAGGCLSLAGALLVVVAAAAGRGGVIGNSEMRINWIGFAVTILLASGLVAAGLGLRALRLWGRNLQLAYTGVAAVRMVLGLATDADPSRGARGQDSLDLAGVAMYVGPVVLMISMAIHISSVSSQVWTKAYRTHPARLAAPRPTPYASPYFWLAATGASLGLFFLCWLAAATQR